MTASANASTHAGSGRSNALEVGLLMKIEERMLDLRARLSRKPVIAGLKGPDDAETACQCGVEVCFYLVGNVFELRKVALECHSHKQMVFAHVDLIQGIARDKYGIQFLAEELGIDGILTTKSHLVAAARAQGILAIQRLFMLDSEALRTGLRMIESSKPHAVEILPALILPNVERRIPKGLPPMIGGGLVETLEELEAILRTPAIAVSTSKKTLWNYRR